MPFVISTPDRESFLTKSGRFVPFLEEARVFSQRSHCQHLADKLQGIIIKVEIAIAF